MARCKERVDCNGRCYWLEDGVCASAKHKGSECKYEPKTLFPKPQSQAEQLDRVLKKLGYWTRTKGFTGKKKSRGQMPRLLSCRWFPKRLKPERRAST